jgi:DNA-binding protein HU-beta
MPIFPLKLHNTYLEQASPTSRWPSTSPCGGRRDPGPGARVAQVDDRDRIRRHLIDVSFTRDTATSKTTRGTVDKGSAFEMKGTRRMWEMTNAQFVAKLADKAGLSKSQTAAFIGDMVGMITNAVKKGEPMKIPNLGGWRKRKSAARIGRNPQTGEPIKIPARVKVRFTVAKSFKEAVLGKK